MTVKVGILGAGGRMGAALIAAVGATPELQLAGLAERAGHPAVGMPVAEALGHFPVILPPPNALIRRMVESYLASLGLAGLRPAVETVSLAVGRGLCLQSDALWLISRGVIAHELERGEMIELPTGMRFLSGTVGLTRRQSVTGAALLAFETVAREIARQENEAAGI